MFRTAAHEDSNSERIMSVSFSVPEISYVIDLEENALKQSCSAFSQFGTPVEPCECALEKSLSCFDSVLLSVV